MPVISTASLKKGSQTVLGAYRGATLAYNARSFYRDFAQLKTLNHGVGPNITFTRGSIGTYFDANGVLQTASNDVPRFDHSGGTSLGLLIEESRQNLFQRSAEFDNAYWIKTSTTVTADSAVAPDGTTTADLTEKTGNDATTPARVVSVAASAYTLSAFFKNNTGGRARLRIDATGGTVVDAVFDIVAGTIVSASAGLTTSIVNAGSGWFRCGITYTFAGAVNATFGISARNTSADNTGAKAWIWGAQLEQGAFPTSYIPTTSAAVTRSADLAKVTPISSFYNASEGTLFVEYRTGAGTPVAGVLVVDDGTNDNRVALFLSAAQVAIAATFTNVGVISATANTVFKTVLGYKANDHAASISGAAATTNTAVGVPSGLTTLGIGAEAGGTFAQPCGHIRRIAYYPKRLSNALLQSLTT